MRKPKRYAVEDMAVVAEAAVVVEAVAEAVAVEAVAVAVEAVNANTLLNSIKRTRREM